MAEHSFPLQGTEHSAELTRASNSEQHQDNDSADLGAADVTKDATAAAGQATAADEEGSRNDWRGSSSGKQYLGSDSLPASMAG
jgi:hypothetical protein